MKIEILVDGLPVVLQDHKNPMTALGRAFDDFNRFRNHVGSPRWIKIWEEAKERKSYIGVIKAYRALTSSDLKTAKAFIDDFRGDRPENNIGELLDWERLEKEVFMTGRWA